MAPLPLDFEEPCTWAVVHARNPAGAVESLHVAPVGDTRPHRASPDCPCGPDLTDDGTTWIHRSYDGREAHEPPFSSIWADGLPRH